MHGGIWTLCMNLEEHEYRQLISNGLPTKNHLCVNYLAGDGADENKKLPEDVRTDWQHSESPLQPHLSRYTKCVLF
jgi:hypothetical protein